MFSRIAEAKRILSYREPEISADIPTCEIRPAEPLHVSRVARFIAWFLEAVVFIVIGSWIAALAVLLVPHKSTMSIATVASALTSVLVLIFNQHVHKLTVAIQKWLRIAEHIAPYFGHRIERAHLILRS